MEIYANGQAGKNEKPVTWLKTASARDGVLLIALLTTAAVYSTMTTSIAPLSPPRPGLSYWTREDD